jgi:hypothetical protein
MGHGKGFARTRDPKKNLMALAGKNTLGKGAYGLGLIPLGRKAAYYLKLGRQIIHSLMHK